MSSKCVVCLKDIPAGARKCTECESYQDPFRRYVFAWSGIVGALVALFPLWSAAWSLSALAFPAKSDVSLREMECSRETLSVIVLNSGGQPAQVLTPQLKLLKDGKATLLEDLGLEMSTKLAANDLISERFEIRAGQNLPLRSASSSCMIVLSLKFIDAASKKARLAEGSCPCPD